MKTSYPYGSNSLTYNLTGCCVFFYSLIQFGLIEKTVKYKGESVFKTSVN